MVRNTYKVLIADDDKTLMGIECAFIKKYMQHKHVDCSITRKDESFPALFELCDHGDTYDLIILDSQMPNINGEDILSSLLHLENNYLNHIVFITADPEPVQKRFPNRNLHILKKPFSYKDFKSLADKVLSPFGNEKSYTALAV